MAKEGDEAKHLMLKMNGILKIIKDLTQSELLSKQALLNIIHVFLFLMFRIWKVK